MEHTKAVNGKATVGNPTKQENEVPTIEVSDGRDRACMPGKKRVSALATITDVKHDTRSTRRTR